MTKIQFDSLLKVLRNGVLSIHFIKVSDGSIRIMAATLDPEIIAANNATPKNGCPQDDSEDVPEYIRVFDVEARGWRSIVIDTIWDVSWSDEDEFALK